MADDMPKVEFCEFQECERQNKAPQTKLHMMRSDVEVEMVAAHHLGGRRGGTSCVRGGKRRNGWPRAFSGYQVLRNLGVSSFLQL